MASGRRKKTMSTKKWITLLVILALVLLALMLMVRVLRSRVTQQFGVREQNEIQSAQVSVGSIRTTISGSGTLQNEEAEEITIPESVEVTEIYVDAGDFVEKGEMLASVNSVSVLTAMAEIQEEIDALDEELDRASQEEAEDSITSGVAGRVKKIYAEKGTALADSMYEHQALMLLSLDGFMAVDIEADGLSVGEQVTVRAGDGSEYDGTVDSIWAGKATVLVSDRETVYGDEVVVCYGDSRTAAGSLYIHEEVAITGYAGTVSAVKVSENQKVNEGTTLFVLKDISSAVNYQTLLKKRQDLEEDLQDLIVIYKEGAVYAQKDGLITSVTGADDSAAVTTAAPTQALSASGFGAASADGASDAVVIALSPAENMTMVVSVDESQILSLSIGQEVTVTVDALENESFEGTITDINKVGESTGGVTSYSAAVILKRTDVMLEGMSASAEVTVEGREQALLVPSAAVQKTSSTSYVYTSCNAETGELEDMTEVSVGISDGDYTEIFSGLEAGDTVYYTEEPENTFDFSRFGGGMGGGSGAGPGGGFAMPGN